MQAEYTQFQSHLLNDAGENALAEACVDQALGLAQMAQDRQFTAYLLACKAELAGRMGVAVDAVGAAEQALRMSAPRSRVAAAAAAFAGHGHALSGDHTAMERAYERSHDQLATTEDDPDCPCRTWWLDQHRIAAQRARSQEVLGEYHTAAQSYQDALAQMPGRYRRGRGVWLTRTALAFAGDRQVEHAATMGLDALAIGTETGSARILTELAHLNNTLAPWHAVPAVADFRTAMKDTVSPRA